MEDIVQCVLLHNPYFPNSLSGANLEVFAELLMASNLMTVPASRLSAEGRFPSSC